MIAKQRKAREEYLVEAIKKAEEAAIAAKPAHDGGSCNLDFLQLNIKGITEKTMQRIGEQAGVRISRCRHRHGAFQIHVSVDGQAAQRTIPLEAACRVLEEYGFKARVHYITD